MRTLQRSCLHKADIAALILAESKDELSSQTKNHILEHALQYSKSDLAVVDWNSALLVDSEMPQDVADTIEFCLTHLLVMRHYDSLLDDKLSSLYDSLEARHNSLFRKMLSNFYSRMEEDSAQKYIEFSEFITRVENSLKNRRRFLSGHHFPSCRARIPLSRMAAECGPEDVHAGAHNPIAPGRNQLHA